MSPRSYRKSCRWESNTGRTASIFGAVPYLSEQQKINEGWKVVETGFVPMWRDGTVGGGRVPHKTLDEARAFYGQETNPEDNYV